MRMELAEENVRSRDWILGLALALLGTGLVMVYSAAGGRTTSLAGADKALLSHALHVLLGLTVLWVVSRVDYHAYRRWATHLWVVGVVLLAIVLCFPPVKGARRWIVLSSAVRFQPSELMKLALVLCLAKYLSGQQESIRTFKKGFMAPSVIVGVACALIFVEKDLGTSALVAVAGFTLMLVAGSRPLFVVMLGCVALPLLFERVRESPYQWQRIVTFLNPYAYPDGAGYHSIQSLIALGSGGWFGLGLGCGRHKLLFVPETRADSVFCVIGEETGFVGAALVVAAYMLLVREGIKAALRAPDLFGSLLAFGITLMIGLQAAINVAVVTVSVPTKGLPLPLISAGGSAILVTLASLGVLLNVAKQGSQHPPAADPCPVPAPQAEPSREVFAAP